MFAVDGMSPFLAHKFRNGSALAPRVTYLQLIAPPGPLGPIETAKAARPYSMSTQPRH